MIDLTVNLITNFWGFVGAFIGYDFIAAVGIVLLALGFILKFTKKTDTL